MPEIAVNSVQYMLHKYRLLAYVLFVVSILFAVLPPGLSWTFDLSREMTEGSLVRKLQWSSLFGLAGFLLWKVRFIYFKRYFWGNAFVALLMLFSAASVFWSPFPVMVIRQMIQFVGVFMIGIAVAIYLGNDIHKLISICLDVLTVVLFCSIVAVFVAPTVAIETAVGIEGSWRGILEQKNTLGISCGVSLLLWIYVQTNTPRHWLYACFVLAIILICLVNSRSSSSLFFGVFSVFVYLLLYRERLRAPQFLVRGLLFVMVSLLVMLLMFFFVNNHFPSGGDILGPFSAIFGKSSDLTGRGDIWIYMWQSIADHWWLGAGYASFWMGLGGPSQFIVDALKWGVPNAHNGYLEVMNELGLIGFGLYWLMLIFHVKNLLLVFYIDRRQFAFHLAVFLIYVISNFSESTALRVTSFLQLIMIFSMMLVQYVALRVGVKTMPSSAGVKA